MADRHSSETPSPSTLSSWIISICFWSGLGGVTVLLGVLVLSPRWLEVERSQAAYAQNAQIILDIQRENARLARIAHALEFDPDYLSRVAARELRLKMPGELKIPSGYSQDFTQETAVAERSLSLPAAGRMSPLIELLGTSAPVRRRCLIATVLLGLLTSLCSSENFLNGGMRKILRRFSTTLGGRYATPSRTSGSTRGPDYC